MPKQKQKFYVVWKGRKTGIFTSWEACEKQVKGFVGARYKAFGSRAEADAALKKKYEQYEGKSSSHDKWRLASVQPVLSSLSVDAACSGSPGKLEYRCVETGSGRQIFRAGPYADGTNNVGEFLAIVHALTWLAKHKLDLCIYSDSENAIAWVNTGVCKTRLKHTAKNAPLFVMIKSAENWLAENELPDDCILKWDTQLWGENPADFGRK
ncbi:MAG TPA: ribonuclease H family protein [Anaerolineales bacterium]|nr:ribonuclease H family protein [Anaerolineales bacterium]